MIDRLMNTDKKAGSQACVFGYILLLSLTGCKEKPLSGQDIQGAPNVLYIFPDQMRNHAMGFWREEGFREAVNFVGDPVHTPNLDRFAKESVVLTSAMSNCPLSSPHRGILLTGMYPEHSGVPLNCNANRPVSSLRKEATCISDVFSRAGYNCAYIGKLHVDCPTPNDPERPGHYVEERVPAWDAYTPPERRHGFDYCTRTGPTMCTSIPIIGTRMVSSTRSMRGRPNMRQTKRSPTCATRGMYATHENRSS